MEYARLYNRAQDAKDNKVMLAWVLSPILTSLLKKEIPMWKILGEQHPDVAKASEDMLENLAQKFGLRRMGV